MIRLGCYIGSFSQASLKIKNVLSFLFFFLVINIYIYTENTEMFAKNPYHCKKQRSISRFNFSINICCCSIDEYLDVPVFAL